MTTYPDLIRLNDKPSLRRYMNDVWDRRDFATEIAVGEIRSQHMNTVLGNFWHILNPVLQLAIYALVFGFILDVAREGVDNLIPFLAVGVFLFHYVSKSVTAGAKSISSNMGLIRSIQFPRAVLPLSTVIAHTIAFVPALVLMFAIGPIMGEPVRWTWLYLPPILVGLMVFTLGVSMIAARLTDAIPDFANLLPFLFRMAFYLSGVIFSVEARFSGSALEPYEYLFDANPLYAYISLARVPVLGGDFRMEWVISATVWTFLALIVGFFYFRAGEQKYGRG